MEMEDTVSKFNEPKERNLSISPNENRSSLKKIGKLIYKIII